MRKEIPAGALEMLNAPGLRPDKVLKVYKELGISSVDELEKAAKGDRLRPVKGLGAPLQSKILQGIEIRRHGEGQRHLHRAATLIEPAREQLGRLKLDLKRVIPAGDFRRGCELVSNLALVAETSGLEGEPRKLVSNSQLRIFVTDRRRAGATLLFATGSKKHIDELRRAWEAPYTSRRFAAANASRRSSRAKQGPFGFCLATCRSGWNDARREWLARGQEARGS